MNNCQIQATTISSLECRFQTAEKLTKQFLLLRKEITILNYEWRLLSNNKIKT